MFTLSTRYSVITYLIRHLNIFVILQVWFSNRRAKGRRERFGDEGSQRQSISAPVCTCHTYRQPLRAPWVMETSFPTFFFPPPGYWTQSKTIGALFKSWTASFYLYNGEPRSHTSKKKIGFAMPGQNVSIHAQICRLSSNRGYAVLIFRGVVSEQALKG